MSQPIVRCLIPLTAAARVESRAPAARCWWRRHSPTSARWKVRGATTAAMAHRRWMTLPRTLWSHLLPYISCRCGWRGQPHPLRSHPAPRYVWRPPEPCYPQPAARGDPNLAFPHKPHSPGACNYSETALLTHPLPPQLSGRVPPLVHFQTPHPSIAWDSINLAVPTQPTELKVTNGPITIRG